ncbi:MAG: 3'(2'),5'-bisphosphate nucleotidase CysQ [Hyphomicrobiales bacterium]|nr:3'(2'),5'-bisphosphate nucleotidase CysQ [Hyphomicrobiales bacterium]
MNDENRIPHLAGALIEATLAGGRAVMAVYAGDFAVDWKNDDTPVSAADRHAEDIIVAMLARAFPDIPIVAEEAVAAGRVPEFGKEFFLVDPLDGTKEFIRRNGEFTVNIGLIENGVPVAGVVLAPALQRVFVAAEGRAFAGSVDADCSKVADLAAISVRQLQNAPVAVASRSHLTPETEAALKKAGAAERRSIGSSLKFCLVAEGEADFYPRLGPTMEWDTAAGDAVLRAAGGKVTTTDGAPLTYGKTQVAGMRDFENPFFYAVGDESLLARMAADEAA